MKIGDTLTKLRNKRGLTQDQMADALNVKRARYNAWENDISKPDIEMLKKISTYHKVTTDYILDMSFDVQNKNVTCNDLDDIFNLSDLTYKGKPISSSDKEKIIKIIETVISA